MPDGPTPPNVALMDMRNERAEDHSAIRELHLAAFGDHGRVVVAFSTRCAHP